MLTGKRSSDSERTLNISTRTLVTTQSHAVRERNICEGAVIYARSLAVQLINLSELANYHREIESFLREVFGDLTHTGSKHEQLNSIS